MKAGFSLLHYSGWGFDPQTKMSYKWQFSTPEAEGLDRGVLSGLDAYIAQKRYRLVNSVLVVKNGKIVFEKYYNGYNEHHRNNIKSIWKSILSIVTGICLTRGLLPGLDEPVSRYLPQFAEKRHMFHKLMTIRHLLTMSSGIYWHGGIHYHCPMLEQMKRTNDWIAHIADVAMQDVPGRQFRYKEWDVLLLSAVISRATGKTAYDIAKEYLYDPLDIASGAWSQSPCGVSYTVLQNEEQSDLSARDLAKIGLLFLNDGVFNGRQIVSSEFVEQALQPAFTNTGIDPGTANSSYGFLWWLFPDQYGCRGYGGQEINVIPDKHFVSVIQATPTPSSKGYEDIHNNILKKAIL
jgi:CubicO group peptidase (beta-lactamase class C family)